MHVLQKAAPRANLANQETLNHAIQEAAFMGLPMMDHVLDHGQVEEVALGRAMAEELKWPWQDVLHPKDEEAADLKRVCPARLALRHRLLPLTLESDESGEQHLVLACYDPFDLMARQAVSRTVQLPVRWCLATRTEILRCLQTFYGVGADTFDDILKGRDADFHDNHLKDEANVIDSDNAEASVVKFVNQIIREALAQRATDIHMEPVNDSLRIRYRIDGVLHEVPVPENIKALQTSVLARLKVMAKLDIAEKRLPQDGRINLTLENQPIDVRVATIPSVEGESISLRLLGQQRFTIDRLGLTPEYRAKIEMLLAKTNGIVLVTGPTGCGKSTSLYTFLSSLNSVQRRIVTIEDPVENKLPGVVQIAVKPEIDLTFASGLRSILRGDPNVIMVGEIRDLETAEIAIRAALTGHLVFSTLHTNDAIGGMVRLVDMGVEPFLVASSVRAFLAQRLVRTLCPHCKVPAHYSPERLKAIGFSEGVDKPISTVSPLGCNACRGTGYHGRLAIYEMVVVTPAMEDLITQRASGSVLLKQARLEGFISMREYGWGKVLQGTTSVEEVVRVTTEDHGIE